MSLQKKVAKGVFWSAIESWGRQLFSFIVFSLLARLLTPDAFGIVALASVFLGFLQLFLNQGVGQAIIQSNNLDDADLNTAFWANVSLNGILTIVGFSIASFAATFFDEPALTPIIQALSLTFLLSGFGNIQQALLEKELQFRALAIRSVIAIFLSGIVGIVMAFRGYGVWSLVGQQLTNSLFQVVILWCLSDWKPGFRFSLKNSNMLIEFGIGEIGFKTFDYFSRRGDDLVIGYFLGSTALGYYTVAYKILLVMTQLLITVTSKIALPAFSKIQGDKERLRRSFYTATQMTSLVAMPAFLAVSVLSKQLIEVVFGSQWLPSAPVMSVLALVGVLQSVSYFNNSVILALGKPYWRLGFMSASGVTNILAYLITVQWGILAVASAYVIRAYLFSPIPLIMIKKLMDIQFSTYFKNLRCAFFSSLAMILIIVLTRALLIDVVSTRLVLGICIASGSLSYIGSIYLFSPDVLQKIFSLASSTIPKKT
ncbi:lipopolysaccharide biosynthesis protein [Leptolyngbya sp. CCNP1308]|uniref:lipopolysaccharide biosynthesis protein n=1 Tax=Leptolyngbya sp. CCNP1308 TaxID=3110255 RepID=UPI002B1FF248|nr:lipopolysaccharide biosynthesis protein [Leptolyngbya sp. CCNP1308]MEA5448619.1 lipopolysaccharide biosynthesis protein [Leptolyngbya sp. CCNP1308]